MYNNIEQFYYLDEQVITFIIFIQSWLMALSQMIEQFYYWWSYQHSDQSIVPSVYDVSRILITWQRHNNQLHQPIFAVITFSRSKVENPPLV